ncbi:hydroxyphenylacetyl-CoA thioesterase PaaI [uncultured Ornithinimicrobium sp.]|uniref:hydroxyphenylacetyl-CoA thioesterase PaaI n=1 Tax=uncultured Ornithinimicrobium sp. TaxID=259307 RepID=UPI002595B7AC|nr:hydroxyphenylacetyl-CoA thioesterase PaaI [uncultured Ornithinimicrobium sp.]
MSTGAPGETPGTDPSAPPDLAHVRRMWAQDRASAHLGIELLDVGVEVRDGIPLGRARARMRIRETMVNGHDIAHGGYVFALADSTFALACNATGRPTVAAGCDITYVAAGRLEDVLVAEARERVTYGRSGITDVTVVRGSDGAVLAEFRGRSRVMAGG